MGRNFDDYPVYSKKVSLRNNLLHSVFVDYCSKNFEKMSKNKWNYSNVVYFSQWNYEKYNDGQLFQYEFW